MTANLVIHKNPYRTHLDVEGYDVPVGLTICQTLCDKELVVAGPNGLVRLATFVVLLNGKPVLQQDWNYVISDDDVVQVAYLPRGGGGGGSNIGNILTAIIIAVAAYFTFGLSLLATAAVGVAALAVLSLTGQTLPSTSLSNSNDSRTSPTYSLDAQGNQARLLQAMPRVYGRMRTFPDLASQPYSEYEGNSQYLYQLFCVSLGEVEIENIYLDDTILSAFEDAEYQIIQPDGVVTLFPDNVITSQAVNNIPMVGTNNSSWATIGPFTVVPVGQTANYLAVDIAFPQGAQTVDGQNNRSPRSVSFAFQYQLIDDSGNTIGPLETLVSETVTFNTQEAQFLTRKVQVPSGRYRVQGYRTSGEATDGMAFDAMQWLGLRAYIQDTKVYGNCTLLAVKMKATNVLNSSTARKFSVISTAKIPVWNPVDGWSAPVVTRNPIWAACDILRNEDYGRGLGTDRINMQRAYQLSQTADTRGDTFNAVFDSSGQLWDAVSKALAVMRTVPMYYAGVIDFVRDEPQTIVKYTATPANMVASSFKVTYNFFDVESPDHVVVEFINEETWETEQISCTLPGRPSLNPATVQLMGCTVRDQAWREGMFIAACNLYRRKNISFANENDGLIPRFMSLTRVSHDVPLWGYSGRCLGLNRVTGELMITEEIPFTDGVNNYIAFRKRDGSEDGPYQIEESDLNDPDNNVFAVRVMANTAALQLIYISNGARDELTYFMAGPSEQRGMRCLVKSSLPDSNGNVNLNLINYSDEVHLAETGGVIPNPPPDSNLPITPAAPIVNSVSVVYTVTVGQQNVVATPAAGAIYYEYQARQGTQEWQNLAESSQPSITVYLSPGEWSIRVRAIGRATGPWATWVGTIEASTLPVPRLDSFTATSQLFAIGLTWSYEAATSVLAKNVEIWAGLTNVLGNASKLLELPFPANAYVIDNLNPGERRYLWARVIDTAGRVGPWFNGGAAITQVASTNPSKLLEALENSISEGQLTQELMEEIQNGGESAVVIQELINELAAMRTVKTQIRNSDGKIITAGFGVGVHNDDGITQSEFIVSATNFYVMDPNNEDDPGKLMFAVTPEGVVFDTAFISTAFIQNIIVGMRLESEALNADNEPLIVIDFATGEFIVRGENGTVKTLLNNAGIQTFKDNILRTRLGWWGTP